MRAFLGDFEEVIFCECFGQGLFVEASGDLGPCIGRNVEVPGIHIGGSAAAVASQIDDFCGGGIVRFPGREKP